MESAQQFARQIRAGEVICLHGDLGAGKTTWVKGFALGLGLPANESVTSPTFAIMHCYGTTIPIYHFDCYRISLVDELVGIGFEEFLSRKDAICCVEWPEKAAGLIPDACWHVSLQHCDTGGRLIQYKKG